MRGGKLLTLYNEGFRKVDYAAVGNIDSTPHVKSVSVYNPAKRIKGGICEICHATGTDICIHHVRKPTFLTSDKMWENFIL